MYKLSRIYLKNPKRDIIQLQTIMDEIIISTKIPFVTMKAHFPKHGLSLFTD